VCKLVKKINFVKSLGFLALIVGIGFFAFENRKVFADKLTTRGTTQTGLTPNETPLKKIGDLGPVTQPSEQNKQQTQIIQGERKSQVIVQQTPTQIIQAPQTQTQRITTAPSETRTLVRRPEFLTKTQILNPKAFNKRKFGIDASLTRQALKKPASSRTITERKQLEANRARQVFDSSKISNF